MPLLSEKVVVISGGTRGLGRSLLSSFLENGCFVAFNYIASVAVADSIAKEFGNRVLAIRCDAASSAQTESMAQRVVRKWGKADVLINNAGTASDSPLLRQSEEEWDKVLGANLKSAFNMTRAFAPFMRCGGHIINISSYSGIKGQRGQAAYSASKAALIGFTKSLAAELSREKIRVNAVLPGYMLTDMGASSPVAAEAAKAESLMGRLSKPQEAALFIRFLSGTENITGQVFPLDSRII
ncbi:MAG: SDR family oxidoreductase [Nitrospirae bacterium]|nr:MAG: SDR family oxidoreductase [Nitrospirota bacterium]